MDAPKTNGLWMLLLGLGLLLFVPYGVRQIRDPDKRWWQKIDRVTGRVREPGVHRAGRDRVVPGRLTCVDPLGVLGSGARRGERS